MLNCVLGFFQIWNITTSILMCTLRNSWNNYFYIGRVKIGELLEKWPDDIFPCVLGLAEVVKRQFLFFWCFLLLSRSMVSCSCSHRRVVLLCFACVVTESCGYWVNNILSGFCQPSIQPFLSEAKYSRFTWFQHILEGRVKENSALATEKKHGYYLG